MVYPTSESNIRKHWRLSWREALWQASQKIFCPCCFCPLDKTHAADTLGRKKICFPNRLLPAHGVQSILNPRSNSNSNLTSSFSFFFLFFSLFTHVRANVRTCKRSREEIIFPKKKKKKISLDYMQSPRYYWIERILESKLKIVTSVGLKRNSRLEVILKVESKVKDSLPELKLTLSRDIRSTVTISSFNTFRSLMENASTSRYRKKKKKYLDSYNFSNNSKRSFIVYQHRAIIHHSDSMDWTAIPIPLSAT